MTNKCTNIFLCRYTDQGWVKNQCFRDLLSATINVNLGNNHKLLTHTDIYTHECACAHTFTHVCTSVIQCNTSSYWCVGLMQGKSNCRALIIPSELALCCLTCRHCALTILQDTKILKHRILSTRFLKWQYIYDYPQITGCKLGQLWNQIGHALCIMAICKKYGYHNI